MVIAFAVHPTSAVLVPGRRRTGWIDGAAQPPVQWWLVALPVAGLLFLPQTIAPMLLDLFLLGIPVGPTMVTIFSIGANVAPKHLMGTVMTLPASGIVAGTALRSSLAGLLADSPGPPRRFSFRSAPPSCSLVSFRR